MNAILSEPAIGPEVNSDESEDGPVLMGKVSETKGGPWGFSHDLGNGWIYDESSNFI